MRLTVSKRTDLAISAYRFLHKQPGRTSGKDIAEAVNTSVPFLSQVLAPLVAAGWLTSRTGPQGGYEIVDRGEELSLLRAIEIIEGPIVDGRCILEDTPCNLDGPCALHSAWTVARASLMRSLSEMPVIEDSSEDL